MSTSTTSPLKTALIGLSSAPTGHGWLNHFHLPALQKHVDKFQITSVLGSSLTNAQNAIKKHNLASSIRAYGMPEDLAKDKEVDFLVVGVKAPLHRDVIMPSLQGGRLKGMFVEWPIGRSLAETEEIINLARAQNLRTAVGLQGRYSAVTRRSHQLIPRIGRILSTTVVGTLPSGDGKTEPAGTAYALDPANGATILDIHFAHFIECLTFALDADFATVSGLAKTMHPTTNLIDPLTTEVVQTEYPKPSPDQILAQGLLRSKSATPSDAAEGDVVYSIHIRGGSSISGGMTWLIYGSNGEIEITSPYHMVPWINLPVPWKIRVKVDGAEDVEEENVTEEEEGQPAVGRLWDAFVEGNDGGWPDFEHALKIHRVVDAVWRSSRDGKVVKL
ncbi:transcription regulator gal80 [Cladophialophora chaetospira]|uniref:Transcription regulator gal80 n=1 Tax=Cladophialophora chaetospira TaxID=386627 RepID=A0AA39CNE8_9EURO|nr:transcription regulator gal80 [Cladophialophora chaetospira]